jgi:mono/diheme cytochrome c family protein
MEYRRTGALGTMLFWSALLGWSCGLGCNQSSAPTASGPAFAPVAAASPASSIAEPTGPFAAGKKVFMSHCARCHSDGSGGMMAGGPTTAEGSPKEGYGRMPGGPPPDGKMTFGKMGGFGRGPNLSHVAADPKHTRQWLGEFILDPQSQKPRSRMPRFAGKINERDLGALVDYLLSLK